ncbi:MAG TPA: hypothetical protein VFP15_12050 [Gemmatimonadaceae bacterium]|nr:hypothetical protein [Gemmatimonadaceae bacterium]
MTKGLPLRAFARVVALLSLVAGIAAAAACVSERTSPIIDTGDCVVPPAAAGTTIVFIKHFAYVPATVHVPAGGSIAWVNCETDGTPHTASADDASFSSGLLNRNDVFVRAFPTPRTAPYHCDLHPFMKATVIVD